MTIVLLAAAWLLGVFLGFYVQAPLPAVMLLFVSAGLLAVLSVSWRRLRPLSAGALVLVVGMLWVDFRGADFVNELEPHHSLLPVQVEGVTASDPESAGSATRLRLRVDKVQRNGAWVEVSGDALVTLRESADLVRQRDQPYFRYGDRLLLEGPLRSPPALGDFDYSAYLARQGIGSVMSFPEVTLLQEGRGAAFHRWLHGARRRMANSLERAIPEPQASLGQALLLGLRDDLPDDVVEEFRASGTSHILAVSGLHLGILLAMILGASQWLLGRRRHLYLVLPIMAIWLYALISGMSPSVVRAAIMGSVYLFALLVGRPRSAIPALSFAAAVMVAVSPNVLWSISFQLSVAAMAGVAALAEPLAVLGRSKYEGRLQRHGTLVFLLDTLVAITAVTIAATVATLPLVAFYFQRVPLVGIPATILTLPALPFVLVSQAAAGLAGLWSETIAQPLGWLAWIPTAYLTSIVDLFARIPGSSVDAGRASVLLAVTYYAVIGLLYARSSLFRTTRSPLASPRRAPPRGARRPSWWLIAPVTALAALLWIAALSTPDQRLHVAFVDVGQGDATFITTPSGRQVLVDGGPDPLNIVRFLGEEMPVHDRTIELVVLTHPHADHVRGLLEVMRRYDVERILERKAHYDSSSYLAWRRAVEAEGAEVIQAEAGQVISFGDGTVVEVVNPAVTLPRGTGSDLDNASVVIRVVHGNASFLLTGDLFSDGEAMVLERNAYVDSDVLKVGHHGSRTSSSRAFLRKVSPVSAVISVGGDNRFGHPHPETLEALDRWVPERLLFLTSERGTVEFVTDGRRLEARAER